MRPNVTWHPSPNFKKGRSRKISCVVIHATATSGIDSPKDWLCNPASQVSAHYLIGRTGVAFQLVQEADVAWHAGESNWRGQDHVNAFSIGIELVNSNDGIMEYPADQLEAAAQIVAGICKDYRVKPEDVIGHLDVAPGRKTDPAGFPWGDFYDRVDAAGKETQGG